MDFLVSINQTSEIIILCNIYTKEEQIPGAMSDITKSELMTKIGYKLLQCIISNCCKNIVNNADEHDVHVTFCIKIQK